MRSAVRAAAAVTALLASTAVAAIALTAERAPASGATKGDVRSGIGWSPCPGAQQVQCGRLSVPLDWARPQGPKISVAVARRPADSPARRVGTLFYNPGGPGDGGVGYVAEADRVFSATLRDRFDIVSMDPRGVGDSTPVRCSLPLLRPEHTLFPRTAEQYHAQRRYDAAMSRSCVKETGPLLGHLDTVSVARDHEALRRALRERQVSWLGISYGVQVAANFAELFPSRTRAMVLDSALDHAGSDVTRLANEVQAAEQTFNRFAAWCDTAPTCALRGQDVAAVYDDLVRRADAHPIPVKGALRPVTGEDIRMGTPKGLTLQEPSIYGPELSWAGLSRHLKAAVDGDASAFALPPAEASAQLAPLFANACLDYVSDVADYDQMRQRIDMAKALAPHLQGASELWQAVRCRDWAVKATNAPRRLDVRGVPALVVNATHDPSTAYEGALDLASQISGSDLLTRLGNGHTSYYTSRCARQIEDQYLIRPEGPPSQTCKD